MNNYQDVFISYGRADSKAFAVKIYEYLTKQGLNVWFDFENIPLGVDFQNQIDDGIEKADNFLFIIAPHSVNPPYCLKEEGFRERNRLIGHNSHVNSVAFSLDGQTLASASDDKTVKLWNLADFTLDALMRDACAWVGDYLKYNAPESDKELCNGINSPE